MTPTGHPARTSTFKIINNPGPNTEVIGERGAFPNVDMIGYVHVTHDMDVGHLL